MAADRERVASLAREPQLIRARLKLAGIAAAELQAAGILLRTSGAVVGDGRTTGGSKRSNGDDAEVGVGVLAQIAGELLRAAAPLLCGDNPYAGAALLRQIVEVEYLTWAFANEKRDAAEWLNSTHRERMQFFTPRDLRDSSEGRFLSSDYQHHCEQGGHPVPRAIPLLGKSDTSVAQMLMLDLLLHTWRSTDNLVQWGLRCQAHPVFMAKLRAGQQQFAAWAQEDALYEWSLNAAPAPPPP